MIIVGVRLQFRALAPAPLSWIQYVTEYAAHVRPLRHSDSAGKALGLSSPARDDYHGFIVGNCDVRKHRNFRWSREVNVKSGAQGSTQAVRKLGQLRIVLFHHIPSPQHHFSIAWRYRSPPIIVLLPILTALLKMIAASVLADIEEIVPLVVIIVVLFNALFQAKCMQTSGSVWTTVGIIGIDVIQNVYSLRKLFRYMLEIRNLVHPENGSTDLLGFCSEIASNALEQLGARAHGLATSP